MEIGTKIMRSWNTWIMRERERERDRVAEEEEEQQQQKENIRPYFPSFWVWFLLRFLG
jgi:hypothetical protein